MVILDSNFNVGLHYNSGWIRNDIVQPEFHSNLTLKLQPRMSNSQNQVCVRNMFARLVPIFPTTHDLASLDEDFAGLDLNQRKSYLDPSSFDQLQLQTNIDLSARQSSNTNDESSNQDTPS